MPLRRGRTVAAAAPPAEGGAAELARQLESERRCGAPGALAAARVRSHARHTSRRPQRVPGRACGVRRRRPSGRLAAVRGAACCARHGALTTPRAAATWRGRSSTILWAAPRASCWRRWSSARERCCRSSDTRRTCATCASGCIMCARQPRSTHQPRSRADRETAQADCCNEPKDIFDFMEVRRQPHRSLPAYRVLTRLPSLACSTTASGRTMRCSTRRAPRSWSCEATRCSHGPSTKRASAGAHRTSFAP